MTAAAVIPIPIAALIELLMVLTTGAASGSALVAGNTISASTVTARYTRYATTKIANIIKSLIAIPHGDYDYINDR